MPEATIVFGHMGAYFHGQDALAVAERCDNVVLETSACPYPELIGEAVRRVGAERVIFGSDGPGCPPAIELEKVRRAGLAPGRPAQGAVREPARAHGPGRAMIADALVYAGACLYGGGRTLAELLAAAEAAGIDRLVAAPAKPRDYDLAGASERLADECAAQCGPCRLPGAARSVAGRRAPRVSRRCSITPRCAGCCCIRGRRRSPPTASARSRSRRRRRPAAIRCSSRPGHPLVAEALSLADLARRVDGTVVMTRGGQVNMSGLAQQSADLALAAAPNLRALSAGMYRQDWLESCVRQFGAAAAAARVVRARSSTSATRRERVRRAHMDDDERAAVMGGNAAALFGLATEGGG